MTDNTPETPRTEVSWQHLQERMQNNALPVAVISPWGKRRLDLLEALVAPLVQPGNAFWWGAQQVQLPLSGQDLNVQHFNTQPTLGGRQQAGPTVVPADLSDSALAAWLTTQIISQETEWSQQQQKLQQRITQIQDHSQDWEQWLDRVARQLSLDRDSLQAPAGLNRKQDSPPTASASSGQLTVISGHRDDLTSWREESLLMLLAFLEEATRASTDDRPQTVILEDWMESVWPRHRWVLAQALEPFLQQPNHYCLIATENPLNWQAYEHGNKLWQSALPLVGSEYQGGWPDFWSPAPDTDPLEPGNSHPPALWVGRGNTTKGAQYFGQPAPAIL